jgi:FixJ family two-component response regulator
MSSLLLFSSRAQDSSELKEVLRGTPWELTAAVSRLEDAAALLAAAPVPILLFDRDAAGACWQDTMKQLIEARKNACVVLLSGVSDQYLWEEVVQHGGFDLLTRPFRKEQVLSALLFANAHVRAPWPEAVR